MIDLNEEPPASEMQLDERDAAAAAAAGAQAPDEAEPKPGDPASHAAGLEHGTAPAPATEQPAAEAMQPDAELPAADAVSEEPAQAQLDGGEVDAPDLGVDGDDEVACCFRPHFLLGTHHAPMLLQQERAY